MSRVFYQCQRCGNCCRWPGEVPVGDEEIRRMALHLEMPENEFIRHYTRLRENRVGLALEDKGNSDECIFLDGIDCRVNDVKPDQCRGFPNTWNFPGWRDVCEAIPIEVADAEPGAT